jgi:hypothetical protein
MNIYYIREFWFDQFYEGSGVVQSATITWTDFNQQNIKVTAQLNAFSPNVEIEEKAGSLYANVGLAAVNIGWYEYIDDHGALQHVDDANFSAHATIYRCVALQLVLTLNQAWVGATGAIYYFTD